ncbi:uncharacterized protein N7484_005062, partial [Penicillium longicatenatum]|uniref:uncharacterized protein n=1 Tax=Penicillium longicatenatum TaxID=1561947 RepID=UPI002548D08E
VQNIFQLAGVCFCNVGLLSWGILQIWWVRSVLSSGIFEYFHIHLILVPTIMGMAVISMIGMTWRLRAEFSWSIYKDISADSQMYRKLYTYQVTLYASYVVFAQVYVTLLKFDFFFIFGSQVEVLLVLGEIDNDFILNAAMVPVAIMALFLAAIFCRKEMKKSMFFPMLCMSALIGNQVKTLLSLYSSDYSLISCRVSLGLFASTAILLIACTMINAFICVTYFEKGSKHHFNQPPSIWRTADGI